MLKNFTRYEDRRSHETSRAERESLAQLNRVEAWRAIAGLRPGGYTGYGLTRYNAEEHYLHDRYDGNVVI